MNQVVEILKKELGVYELKPSFSMDSLDSWDSLVHIRMITALESELDVVFSVEDIIAMKSVESIVNVLNTSFGFKIDLGV